MSLMQMQLYLHNKQAYKQPMARDRVKHARMQFVGVTLHRRDHPKRALTRHDGFVGSKLAALSCVHDRFVGHLMTGRLM